MILIVMVNSHEFVYAVGAQLPGENPTQNIKNTQGENGTKANSGYGVDDLIGSTVSGIVGLIAYPFKLIIIIVGNVVRMISSEIALIGGMDKESSLVDSMFFISPDDILFNHIPLTDINFFDFSSNNGAISSIRKNVAIWYSALRNLAIAILLVVLVYIGIRMTISTVAEQEAKYKRMLIDWAVSFALVFLLHYIILAGIYISDSLVELMDVGRESYIQNYNSNANISVDDILDQTLEEALTTISITKGFGAAIVYTALCGVSFIFLVMYIKRMITIAFLIMIAPLITVTYSIDKVKDNQSQALNNWLKEFMVNVLIQPFHCVIYLTITVTGIGLMDGSLGGSILAIIMISFILKGEEIIKAIFSVVQGGKSSTDMAWGAAFAAIGVDRAKGIAKNMISKMPDSNNKNNIGSVGKNSNKKPTINRQSANTDKALSGNVSNTKNSNQQNNKNNSNTNSEKLNGINNDIKGLEGQIQAAEEEGDTVTRDALERQLMKKQVEKSMLMNEANQPSANKTDVGTENEIKQKEDGYFENLKNKAKEGAVKNLKWQAKWGARVGGAALGLTAGSKEMLATGVATEVVGKYVGKVASKKTTELQNVINTKKAEKQFARAYTQYADVEENKTFTNNQMKDRTTKYINGANDENMSEADKIYAKYVQDLYNQYQKIGVENPEQKVIDTVDDVQRKRVIPE